jgi:hypothetical protein
MNCLNCDDPVDREWSRICFSCADKINRDIRQHRGQRWKAFAMAHGSKLFVFEGLEEECRRRGLVLEDGRVEWPEEMSEDQMDFAGGYHLVDDTTESLEALAGLKPLKIDQPPPDLNEILGLPTEKPIEAEPVAGIR